MTPKKIAHLSSTAPMAWLISTIVSTRPAAGNCSLRWDINDMGQITGHGELNGEKRAFVLTPSADTDADGDIDGSDIAVLVQEVGACSGSDCSCDFNGDEAVNNMDVLLQAMLLGHTS
jgi:hypothetical protein